MMGKIIKAITAALLAGGSAGFFAPLLWIPTLYVEKNLIYFDLTLAVGLFAVAFFSILIGLMVGLFIGFPLLLTINVFRIKYQNIVVPIMGAAVGGFTGYIFFQSDDFSISVPKHYIAFSSTLGFLCSLVGSMINSRKYLKQKINLQ